MTKEEKLQKINCLSKRLGMISNLAFKKESLDDIIDELEKLTKICIYEEKVS